MTKPYEVKNERKTEHKVDKIFLDRWSPRALSKEIKEEDLLSLFEAARWSPSSDNLQPWRFLYSINGDKNWNNFFDLLVDFNKLWCKNAGALILVLSKKTYPGGKPDHFASFGAGSAWMSLALQARMKNLIAHGMAGFDKDKAKKVLKISEDYNIEAMVAVGAQGDIGDLHENLQKMETPNSRRPLKDSITKGSFPEGWK
jgi:nitroreductase